MMKKHIRHLLHATAFVPFLIRTTDGQAYRVPHPDYVLAASEAPHIVIEEANGRISTINIMLITSVESEPTSTAA